MILRGNTGGNTAGDVEEGREAGSTGRATRREGVENHICASHGPHGILTSTPHTLIYLQYSSFLRD